MIIDPIKSSRNTQCITNLKQIGLAIHNYAVANEELPTGTAASTRVVPEKRLGWLYLIQGFLEVTNFLPRFQPDEPYDSSTNIHSAMNPMTYHCPSHDREPRTGVATRSQYVGITGLGPDSASLPTSHPRAGVFGTDRRVRFADVKDGMSNTMMVAETAVTTGPWTSGAATLRAVDPARRPYLGPGRDFGGNHPGGGNVLMADGSVKFVRNSVDPAVFEGLSTINGGESIPGTEVAARQMPGREF